MFLLTQGYPFYRIVKKNMHFNYREFDLDGDLARLPIYGIYWVLSKECYQISYIET